MNHSLEAEALAFWRWFSLVAQDLAYDFKNEVILLELDNRIRAFGAASWEVGPGVSKPNALVISPGGTKERLQLCEEIVSVAPEIPEWEFHSVKPPKQWTLRFTVEDGRGNRLEIDASDWEYVLLKMPDGTFDLVIRAQNIPRLDEELRQVAAEVAVDGIVGESLRLRYIVDVDVVTEFDERHRQKATCIKHLGRHLISLVS